MQLYNGPDGQNWAELEEFAEALSGWLAKGGFAPKITGNQKLDALIAGKVCDAIQLWELFV